MYVAFGNRVLDSEDIKKEIELYFKAKSINCIFKAGKRV